MKYQKYNGDNMGLLVDTNKISSEIKNLDKYISDYNDNCADIYFELSKLNNYWKDNNTSVFNEKINQEKIKNLDIIEVLEKISNYYKEVESMYQNFK
ncbi:MAG: hypothetical protein ACLUGB_05785 [Bacilli bacterium]|jgi:hypothetical protein